MRRLFAWGTGLGLGVVAISAGCGGGGNKSGFGDDTPGTNTGDNLDGGGTTDDGATLYNDEAGLFGDGGGTSCQNTVHCSSDLHRVVDCNGTVVKECPPDQGCNGTDCVAACDAAKANKSTIGCDYYSVDPDSIAAGQGACFAVFVANTWSSPIGVTVDRGGQTLDISGFARIPSGSGQSITYTPLPNGQIPQGQVAVLFLARFGSALTSCPDGVTPAVVDSSAQIAGTGLGQAFHIVTTAPAVAYDIFPFGGGQSAATSATLLLPTSSWDTNYIGVNAFRKSSSVDEAQPSMAIVASEDGTTVTIAPTAAIEGGTGVAAASKGQPVQYTLSKGQVLQLSQKAELTGSPIQSDKPIAVWGGATCLSIDVDKQACDTAHQQIPPIRALGHEYVAVRYRNRFDGKEESPPWRMVGVVDGTTLTYEPSAPPGAPKSLDAGQVAEFRAAGPFVLKSQDDKHPFYMSAHMTGCQEVDPTGTDGRGDPEFVNVIPPQEYLNGYTFFSDPTYPETNLVVIRVRGKDGFKDVSLDCAGNLTGWQPIGTSGSYEYTRIDLVRHNFAKQGNCDNGRHEIKSDAAFGLTVWGWGSAETGGIFGVPALGGFYSQAVSYAYPAGASVLPINTVVVPPSSVK